MNVSACLVTRGDVDMQPILDSLPADWEVIVWDNGHGCVYSRESYFAFADAPDLAVYGRYAAIRHASHDLIYVADDDVIVSDPQAIADAWVRYQGFGEGAAPCSCLHGNAISPGCPSCDWTSEDYKENVAVCNMPAEFRPHYPDSALVGFGAVFHRDAPDRAFERFFAKPFKALPGLPGVFTYRTDDLFNRRADNVFTVLTPRVLVDIPKQDREMASAPNRMWKHPGHEAEKQRMIELARKVRDA